MSVRPRRLVGRPVISAAVVLTLVVLAAAAVLVNRMDKEKTVTIDASASPVMAIAIDDLNTVARTRVFFGHQSVGENVLSGVPAVFAKQGVTPPPIEQAGTQPGPDGGFIDHQFIGENGQPLLKIEDFDRVIRGGVGKEVDVALMKLCYVDITTDTDVDALFAAYRDTMAGLERDFPDVTFIHMTVPLTTEPNFKSKVKALLGRGDQLGPAENVAREQLNAKIRTEYADDHLFDLAVVESTQPDGTQTSGRYDDQGYHALYTGYASDPGHLNTLGSEVAATAFLKAIAQAAPR